MTSNNIYVPIKPTYLYIKKHSITGLMYFGKTTKKDPYSYKGSGTRWVNHIKVHGRGYVETLWVSELYHDTSIVEHAMHFSIENNIVESSAWANLVLENGLDGGSAMIGDKNGMFGKTHTNVVKKATAVRAILRFKGKSYEDLYGKEKSDQLKDVRRSKMKCKDNSGKNNPRYDRTIYHFVNTHINETFTGTRFDFYMFYNLSSDGVRSIISGRQHTHRGWKLSL